MRRTLENRLVKLEQFQARELQPKKRTLPDWLQVVYEEEGFVFDAAGQVVIAGWRDAGLPVSTEVGDNSYQSLRGKAGL